MVKDCVAVHAVPACRRRPLSYSGKTLNGSPCPWPLRKGAAAGIIASCSAIETKRAGAKAREGPQSSRRQVPASARIPPQSPKAVDNLSLWRTTFDSPTSCFFFLSHYSSNITPVGMTPRRRASGDLRSPAEMGSQQHGPESCDAGAGGGGRPDFEFTFDCSLPTALSRAGSAIEPDVRLDPPLLAGKRHLLT